MNLDFALTEDQFKDVMNRLHGPTAAHNRDPERGFLATVFVAEGATRRTLILGTIIEPGNGDVRWDERVGLVMSHQYYSRALDAAQCSSGAGLINIHSHPRPQTGVLPPSASPQDLDSDARELCFVSRALPLGRPTAAAIVTPGGGISVREYSFRRPLTAKQAVRREYGPDGAIARYVERIRVVGPALRVLAGDPYMANPGRIYDTTATESSVLLWGEVGQSVLANLRVGIAGLGGVGGMLAEHLARLGVGTLILVDYDRLEMANFNRSQGTTRRDAERKSVKSKVYARIAKSSATAPTFEVHWYRASAAERDGVRWLLDCDVIVGSADDAFARQVLDHAAYAHLIPVIDGGTTLVADPRSMRLIAGKSQIVTTGPGHACLECQGVYTQEEATISRESPTWGRYLNLNRPQGDEQDGSVRAPSVICSNALVASLIGLRLLALALPLTPKTRIGTQRYYLEEGLLGWGAIKGCKSGCVKSSWTGLGDSHSLPIGTDLRWQLLRKSEGQ